MQRPHHRAYPWRAALGIAALLTALAATGYVAVMSGWQRYDDEGYVLMSLRHFAGGDDLYDQVYTQYGPLFYELFGLPFRALGGALGHDAGRLLTLGFWLSASALVGLLVWRLSGRALAWGAIGLVLAFVVLLEITSEPLHPGGFLTVIVAALAATLVLVPPPRSYLVAGALVATLGLTKINLGGLAALAIAFALAIDAAPRTAGGRALRGAVIAACSALPILLMASSLDVPEWRWFALSMSATLLALAFVAAPRGTDPARAAGGLLLGAGVLTLAVVTIILVAGTSLSGLVNGVLVEPLGLNDAFSVPPPFDSGSLAVTLAVLALVVLLHRRRPGPAPPLLDVAVGVIAVLALVGASFLPSLESPFVAPMLAPVVLLAGARDTDGLLPVSSLAVFAALQAYPVAGSQVVFGTFLSVVPVVLVLRRGLASAPRLGRLAPAVALALVLVLFVQQLGPELSDYRSDVPLDRPGARRVRLARADRDDLVSLFQDMRGCRTLVGLPGVLSLSLWSRVPPPSAKYAGDWMYLLDARDQQRIVRSVDGARGVCLVRDASLVEFWSRGRPLPDGPLVRWIRQAEGRTTAHGPYRLTRVGEPG